MHRYGARIFRISDDRAWDYARQFVRFNHYVNSPVVEFHYELWGLPFNTNVFSKMWGISISAEVKAIIEARKAEAVLDGEPANLEEQTLSLVSHDVLAKLVCEYAEKQ